jgi:proline iminopeptidase
MRPDFIATLLALGAGLAACDGIHDASASGNLVPRTVDEDPALPALTFAGSKFHVETLGDPSKPVLVYLHGGPGGDYRDFLRVTQRHDGYALSDDHFVVLWDQRGAGLSRRHDCALQTGDRLDADLDQLVDMFSPGRPVTLVGYSWGGMYAAEYINRHPGKVAGAVLIEPGPLNGPLFDSIAGQIIQLDVFSEYLNDVVWDAQFLTPDDHARADFALLVGMRDSQPRYHQDNAVDPAPVWRLGAVANKCLQESAIKDGKATYDFTNHLDAFKTRVLFIASGRNEVIGAAFQEKQRQYFPAADLVVIPGVGHDLTWTRPAETLAAIHAYLGTVQ